MKILSKLMTLALPVAVAACGGSGDKTCSTDANLDKTCTQNPTHTPPEGIWLGASTTEANVAGASVMTIVLETGQYYNLYTLAGAFLALVEGVMSTKLRRIRLRSRYINTFQFGVCTAIKNSGVTIYAITFGSVSSVAAATMRSCATPGDYYHAPNGATLNSIFQEIAGNLGVLRLVQ